MVFSSAIFLFIFLPITFWGNWLLKDKCSNLFLLFASLFFYAWGEPIYVGVLLASILINWFVGRCICKWNGVIRKLILCVGVVLDLCILGWFKYVAFFIRMFNSFARTEVFNIPQVTLPIGISFFSFQAISYIVDLYRMNTKDSPRLVNTALYISFFPQLVAGPIVKYRDIDKQIESRCITYDGIAMGFKRFVYGLAKKVLIANVLAVCVDKIYSYDIQMIDWKMAWIGAISYTFQIYYDFSGYSDMAIGLGRMFGFTIPENFNYPYLSRSINEFWRRWHISLGTWFREYVYIPLGGNRKGGVRTYINLMLVFLLTGLWHGADFSFVIWGLYNGIFIILERIVWSKTGCRLKFLPVVYSFFVVNLGWVLFRADNIRFALQYIVRMVTPSGSNIISMYNYCDAKTVFVLICAGLGMGLISLIPQRIQDKWKGSMTEALYCAGLLVLCFASIASNTYNPFVYFQF